MAISTWRKFRFDEIARAQNARFNPKDAKDRKCIELEHIQQRTGRLLGYTNSIEQASTKTVFAIGDVLFGKLRPNLEKYWYCDFEGVCSSEIWVLRAIKEKCESRYLFYVVQSERFIKAANVTSGTKMPRADWSYVSDIMLDIPPLPEQRAIAVILGTWDRAIALTERRLATAEQRKQALMQQLLTGRVRFPEFAGEAWREVRLGEVLKERKERGYEHLPLVSVTADQGIIYRDELDRRDNSSEDKSKYLRVCPGDLAYNTMRMWQGRSGVSKLEGIVSPAYTVCTPKPSTDIEFIGHLFQLPAIIYLFRRHSQGLVSDTWNLKFEHFSKIKVAVPGLAEQEKIAAVLNACDRELELLRRKRDALQRQKQGLMQRLLTGRVRVGMAQG